MPLEGISWFVHRLVQILFPVDRPVDKYVVSASAAGAARVRFRRGRRAGERERRPARAFTADRGGGRETPASSSSHPWTAAAIVGGRPQGVAHQIGIGDQPHRSAPEPAQGRPFLRADDAIGARASEAAGRVEPEPAPVPARPTSPASAGGSIVTRQWPSNGASRPTGGGRRMSPGGSSLGQVSIGSVRISARPPLRIQPSSATSSAGASRCGCARNSSFPRPRLAASSTSTGWKAKCPAELEIGRRRPRTRLERSLLAPDQRQAGHQHHGRARGGAVRRRPRAGPRLRGRRLRRRPDRSPSAGGWPRPSPGERIQRACAGAGWAVVVVVGIAGGDSELGERLLGLGLVGARDGDLVAAGELGLDQVGGDRRFVARAGEDRAEQHEQEDEGEAGEADSDPLHALPDLPPLSVPEE